MITRKRARHFHRYLRCFFCFACRKHRWAQCFGGGGQLRLVSEYILGPAISIGIYGVFSALHAENTGGRSVFGGGGGGGQLRLVSECMLGHEVHTNLTHEVHTNLTQEAPHQRDTLLLGFKHPGKLFPAMHLTYQTSHCLYHAAFCSSLVAEA